jgi:hypothetical protein
MWSSIKNVIYQQFSSFWKILISYMREISSLRSKRNENETKSECKMTSIDELKHSIIWNWRDRKNYFSITKRRLIENFLKNLILLSSSLATARWKGEK